MASPPVDIEMIVAIRDALQECADRGLVAATKWVSEILLSIPIEKRRLAPSAKANRTAYDAESSRSVTPRPTSSLAASAPTSSQLRSGSSTSVAQPWPLVPAEVDEYDLELEAEEAILISSAKALMDSKEFLRVTHWLSTCRSAKATFLKLYSEYLYREKKALREWYRLDNTRQQLPLPVNEYLSSLLAKVQNATDAWLVFLKALFLFRLSRREEAIGAALQSIAACPWNWATWTVLGECVGDHNELDKILPRIPLPANHVLVKMFRVRMLNLLHGPDTAEIETCDELLGQDFFPDSLWIMSQRARALYHNFDYQKSKEAFAKIYEIDSYRVDDVDIYANVLYVLEETGTLAKLAEEFLTQDKDRPEVCSLLGNYHSIRREHEKAIKYYRRATYLDKTYLAAWTLMGHEYVELKNPHAAIEAYRKAVDANKKDYRAWFGLGQSYAMLSMPTYALYYFQHATVLRPYDVRIWQAQAACFEETGRYREAIVCLERALVGIDPQETQTLVRLAKLNNDIGAHDRAVHYHRKVYETTRKFRKPITEASKSVLYVARYYLMHVMKRVELGEAVQMLTLVAEGGGDDAGQASELLKKTKAWLATMDAHGQDQMTSTVASGSRR